MVNPFYGQSARCEYLRHGISTFVAAIIANRLTINSVTKAKNLFQLFISLD